MAGRVVSGLSWTIVSSVARNLVSLFQIAILTRFLAVEDFGILAVANLFVAFTTLFLDMGISTGILHKKQISNDEYSSLFWLNILFGIGLVVILYSLAPILTEKYHSQDLTNVVRILCLTIFFNALGTQQRTYSQKMTFFKRMSLIEITASIVTFIVALYTAIKGYGVYSLAYSTLAGSICQNILFLIVGLIKDGRITFHFSFKETLPFLKIGIYQVGSSVLDFLTRELDIMIVSVTLGLEFLGIYNIAKRIPTALYTFVQPIIARVFTPFLAEINGNIILLKNVYLKMSKALSWISFPMYFLVGALAPTVITVMFGIDYTDAVPLMMALCFKYAFNGVNGICGALQTATGRTDIGLKWTIFSIFTTAVIYYSSAQWGIISFLIGVISVTLINVWGIWLIQFKPMVEISWKHYLSIYKNSFVICTILSLIIYLINNSSSIPYALVAGASYIVIFCFLIINSKDGKYVFELIDTLGIPKSIKQEITKFSIYNKL